MKFPSLAFAAVAAFGILPTNTVIAQNIDLDPEAAAAATRYGLPIAFNSFRRVCSDLLPSDGFLAQNEGRLLAKFYEGAQGSWPAAKQLLFKELTKRSDENASFFADMPDEALKPFIDSIFETGLAGEIKPSNCGDIERALELLDPLPVENMAEIVGFFVEVDGRNKRKTKSDAGLEAGRDASE